MYRLRQVNLFVLSMATIAAFAIVRPAAAHGNMQDKKSTQSKPTAPPGQFPVTRNTGTAKPNAPINSSLMIFTVNGGGTTVTKTNGEFGSTLASSATVGKEFALRWTRTKSGKPERGTLYVIPPNSGPWVEVQKVTMPVQSTSLDIQYTMPNLTLRTYELMMVGDTGNSTRVTINYNGSSPTPVVITPGPAPGQIAASKGKVTEVKFTPQVGTLNEPGYQGPKISITLEATADWTIKEIGVEVYSEPFMKSGIVTASGSKNAPIQLYTGTWKLLSASTYTIHPGTPKVIAIQLHRTSKGQVNAQETGPGIYTPADWNVAFAQTTTASFRWTVDGKPFGSVGQSLKKQWLWP